MSAFKKAFLSVLLLFSLLTLAPAALAQGNPPARISVNGFSFSLFPAEHDPNFGVLELQADLAGYMNASLAALNEAAPGDFAPALDHLEALLDSIAFAE